MKYEIDPSHINDDDFNDYPYRVEQRNDFKSKQSYEVDTCYTYICKKCGSDQFMVGYAGYLTAIKCKKCNWERIVHDG